VRQKLLVEADVVFGEGVREMEGARRKGKSDSSGGDHAYDHADYWVV